MASEAGTFTYTLYLHADPNKASDPHVRIRDGNKFWIGVKKGDRIQFAIDSSVPNHDQATPEVEFTSTDDTSLLPFEVGSIDDTNSHEVVSDTRKWMAKCFIRVGGKRFGYASGDGHLPCPNC